MPREKSPMRPLPSGVITAMFTDIVDSTRVKSLMEGETSARRDALFRKNIKEPHDAVVLSCAHDAGGYIVNPTGDGYCITFVDGEEAVLCALRIQKHLREHPIETPQGPMQIRIGLHTGIAGPSGDDYIASTIDKTARVQSKAGGGQVFVSHQTQVLVSERIYKVEFQPRGIFDLKGLQAEELYEAIPLPDLELAPVNVNSYLEKNTESSPFTSSPTNAATTPVKQGNGLKWGIGAAVALLACAGVALMAMKGKSAQDAAKDAVPAGSYWAGSFRFLPPMKYDGQVTLQVKQRMGDKFTGVYGTEGDSYQWSVAGTVTGNKLHWEFLKSIKAAGTEDATGQAYCDATVEGDHLTGTFRMKNDAGEIANLEMHRSDDKNAPDSSASIGTPPAP